MNDDIDLHMVRQRVKKGVERQKLLTNSFLFALNVFLFVLFTLIAYGIYSSGDGNSLGNIFSTSGNPEDPALEALILLNIGWFTSLIFHGISLFMNTKLGEQQLHNRVVASELGRELFQLGTDEEPVEKHKRKIRLADDGELEEVEYSEEIENLNTHMSSSSSN